MSKKFFTFYDEPPKVTTVLDYETKFVDQSEADMVGLRYQLQRYGMDGLMQRFEAMKDKFGYADTRLIPSFADLQNRVSRGIEYFNNLPSEIRARFNNVPENFYSYIETNPEDAVKQGYISGVQVDDIKNLSQQYKVDNVNVEPQKVEPSDSTVTLNDSVTE